MPKITDRDISHWSPKRKCAWVRRQMKTSRHYAPALNRLKTEWHDTEFMCSPNSGGTIRGDIFDSEVYVDADLSCTELHDLWIVQSGLEHYHGLIFVQGLLPMEHGK